MGIRDKYARPSPVRSTLLMRAKPQATIAWEKALLGQGLEFNTRLQQVVAHRKEPSL